MKQMTFKHENLVILSSLVSFLQERHQKDSNLEIELFPKLKEVVIKLPQEQISKVILSIPMEYRNIGYEISDVLTLDSFEW